MASFAHAGNRDRFTMCRMVAILLGAGLCGWTLPAHADRDPLRNVYFGETHVHTSWSFDAYVFGNTLAGPEDAYQYALGKPIRHPGGYMVQIKRPLDFLAVTDHSEYMGTVRLANDPQSDLSKLPIAEKLKVRSREDIQKVYLFLATSIITEPVTELIRPEVAGSVWKRVVEIADKYNQPGRFTTFAAYEWSSTPDNRNLHRNILFKDTKKVPSLPFTAIDSDQPEDLWKWMDGQRKAGNELLAISHNANLSDGVMFPLEVDSKGRPIDAAWAQSRVNNEPLAEIQQLKGASETHPALSPTDEFAGHEILEYLLGGIDRAPQASRQLHPRGVPERPGDAGHARLQPVQVRPRRCRRYAQYRDVVYPIELFRRPRPARRHATGSAQRREAFRDDIRPVCDGRARRRVGRGKHARGDLRGHAAQGDLRHERRADQGAALRRLGLRAERLAKKGLGQDRLCKRRSHGRRTAGGQVEGADVHCLGRQGSRRRQSRSHPDRQGLDAKRADLREDLQRRLV